MTTGFRKPEAFFIASKERLNRNSDTGGQIIERERGKKGEIGEFSYYVCM
ncbi:hypothetical protein HanXRQr2_Chr06g0251551 [Helianthus annuus]|uniref:Uncharacterized protein n=1 Tax=Helianthus annuus TaxID=4232 RepID=A0A9K3IRX8_HELAN|nr:hypothetical protein HanXRQr2_Chr06g0251551 [Helianthus annuus]